MQQMLRKILVGFTCSAFLEELCFFLYAVVSTFFFFKKKILWKMYALFTTLAFILVFAKYYVFKIKLVSSADILNSVFE